MAVTLSSMRVVVSSAGAIRASLLPSLPLPLLLPLPLPPLSLFYRSKLGRCSESTLASWRPGQSRLAETDFSSNALMLCKYVCVGVCVEVEVTLVVVVAVFGALVGVVGSDANEMRWRRRLDV